MRGNFEACLAETLRHEGGWSDHPEDPGGATMRGVTLATFRKYRPGATKSDLRAISDQDLRKIYRDGYWDKVRGDDLPAGMDLVAFDGAVNSGPARGAKWLQSALIVKPDGAIGPATISAAHAGLPGPVIRRACQDRLRWLQSLSKWPTFGKGWTARVVAIEAAALEMAGAGVAPPLAAPVVTVQPIWLAAIITTITAYFRGTK